jgi:hypothetical protein
MKPGPTRGWFSRMTAAFVSAALVVSAFAPGSAALAADLQLGRAAEARPIEGGVSGVQPLTVSAFLSAPALSPLSAGAAPAPAAAPAATAAALPQLGGHLRPAAVVAVPSLLPAAPAALIAAPAAADGPVARAGAWLSRMAGLSPAKSADDSVAAPAVGESAGAAKSRADAEFNRLTGEANAPERADLPDAAAVSGAESAAPAALAPAGRLAGMATAESRIRSSAKGRAEHLRLLRVSVDLRGSGARWSFSYHAPAKKQILTYGPKGAESRKLGHGEKPTMLKQEELASVDMDRDLAAVKAENPGFKAVRGEVLPRATGGFVVMFYDAKGRSVKAPAALARTIEVPAPVAAPVAPAATAEAIPAPEAAAVPPAEAPVVAPAPIAAQEPGKYLHEDFFGFRTVRGVKRDAALGPLPADADVARVIAQISAQFGIPREDVLQLASKFRLDATSPRAAWLAVYDRLQNANRERFKRMDSHKYDGRDDLDAEPARGSFLAFFKPAEMMRRLKAYTLGENARFRTLANRTYAPGLRGRLLRQSELHKHLIGVAFRFPYHLFDMFLFGYFRQAIAFEFFHSGEDFLSLAKEKDMAHKWLEASMRQQGFYGAGALGELKANAWYRRADRWFLTPLAKPLATFLVRRVTLAVMSAVAMGLLGAFAPALPLSFALTSLPLLGPGIVWALNGIPVAAAAIPFVGHFLAPVVAATVGAFAKDLVLGPLLNTMILSTLLTYPNAVRERLAAERDKHPTTPLTPGERVRAVAGAAITWKFWRTNLKSFFGLATVGAEIAGIMTYATQIDAVVDPGFQASHKLGDHHAGIFEMIGAAVERPKGESSIPFGGAITWGSVLLFKLQDVTGFHISEAVMGAVVGAKSLVGAEDGTHGAHVGAAAVVHAAETRDGAKIPFDPDLWKKSPAEAAARIKELAATAGALDAETAAVKDQMEKLRARLGDRQAKLAQLEKQSKPIDPQERAEYERLLKDLSEKRAQGYVESKLAERHDLLNPLDDAAKDRAGDEMRKLKALQDKYRQTLPPPPPDRNGVWEELATREASYKALAARLTSFADGGSPTDQGPVPKLDPRVRDQIVKLVGEIENQRAEVTAEMSQRDATQSLIRASNQIRNHALHERRNGQDMLRFHTDFAKLATVMDLALSLNEIAAAQTAIKQMLDLLAAKRAAITASQQTNQQGQQNSAANQAQVAAWNAQAAQTIAADKQSIQDMLDQKTEAQMASQRAGDFQRQMSALIAGINAMDRGSSADAATQYQANLNKLDKAAEWRQNGNPNDPTAFSVKQFQDNLAEVTADLATAKDGLAKIKSAPIEFPGAVIILVPGPAVTLTNPSKAQIMQTLADRRSYWQQKLATYQGNLNTVNQLMDPNHAIVDEFGLSHGYNQSVTNMGTVHSGNPAAGSKADALQDFAQLDRIAVELNDMTHSQIPMLSGRSLTDLQTTIKTYGDALKGVKFPVLATETPASHQAKMDLILAAQLTPMAARAIINWSVDQATVDAFTAAKAPGGALPTAQQGLTTIVAMLNTVLADVNADVAFENSGASDRATLQALLDRKAALVQNTIIPGLTQAQSMLNTLIAYEQNSIKDVSGATSQYYTLFSSEQTLLTQTQDLYNKTLPWALASFGGTSGDVPNSLASIAAWKASLQKYVDGYTDATGKHEGITDYQKDLVDRECQSGCSRTEVLYGETQPYSLTQKISQYGAEQAQRAQEMNAQDSQINEILGRIQSLSGGKYNLSAYMLPTGVGTDAGSAARVQAVVDSSLIQNLGDQLKTIANKENSGGSGVTINAGSGSGTVPVGPQPSPTVSNGTQIALLALDAAKRLVPSSLSQPSSAPEAYAVARYLYSKAVVAAAQDGLTNQVPTAKTFLQHASQALGGAIAQTSQDVAYVNSNGSSESPDAVYARKVALFNSLDAFLSEGMAFYGVKTTWDQGANGTINQVGTYYNSLNQIYTSGSTVNQNEITALDTMQKTLQDTFNSLDVTRQKVASWMTQLDPKEQSALNRVSDDVSRIQEKTRAVLEANVNWHDLEDQLKRSRTIVQAGLTQMDEKQQALAKVLNNPDVQDSLPPDLVRRIESLRMGKGAWSMGDPSGQAQALVVKKSEYSAFLDTMMGMLTQGSSQLAHQDVSAIKGSLLNNPQGLAAFIPGSSVMDFGDNADGFYLVYQSRFAVPNGLETGNWVTLGNIAQLWGNNVSVNGYAFSSPPSSGGQNAPYGDKGVEVQVESLQNRSAVNYLNVDLHRFAFDIPSDNSVAANAGESRLMVFDDYAMMLMGDKLYVGLAGYGDMALNKPGEHPYYYGGNVKTSLKLTEVMSLNASQQELFARDPRSFMENVNLDFTGYDPALNRNFNILAKGDQKYYSRTQVGPSFDVNRLLHPDGGGDTFTVDLFYAKTAGTDDINQQSVGATVLKGFSIKNDEGKTWLRIDNRLTGEAGQAVNKLGDRLSFTLPDKGITVSGEGQLIGDKSTHYAEISKKTGDNTTISLGYGSQYVGQSDRLSIMMNTSFTLAQLWQAVADNASKGLAGGETLKAFNKDMTDFFANDSKGSQTVAELSKVYEQDVARKLMSQDIGTLTKDIQDLRKAGAFMDNTRVRGMVGFTSQSVSNDSAELAVGGGFTVGTYTEMTLTKTQKALVEAKSASLYREGMRLQDRLLQITKDWQSAVVDLAQAQWDLKLANFQVQNAPSEPVRREAEVGLASAADRAHQALLRYNALTGRDPSSASPLENLNAGDLKQLMGNIRSLITAPDRYQKILGALNPDEIKKNLGPNPFNAMDWIPWVDKLSLGFGVQYQDIMANQVLTVGASVRLPIYDPASKGVNKAYVSESKAVIEEMKQAYEDRRLVVAGERERAAAWRASADAVSPQGPAAAKRMSDDIRAYRNGLIGPDEMRSAFDAWRWYAKTTLEAESNASLASAQAAVDEPMLPKTVLPSGAARITSLPEAFSLALSNAHSLREIANRSIAAEEMAKAEDHRVQKFWVDIGVGTGLTAKGLGWIPSIGITGIPVTPVFGFELKPEELRELQVEQHSEQKQYYDALKTRLEAGLAVQFYQNVVGFRSAQTRLALYDQEVLPRLQADVDKATDPSGRADAVRALDGAKLGRAQTGLAFGQSRSTLNLLLGRAADAPLDVALDQRQALVALSQLLADKKVVQTQRDILDARVKTARAVENMVDKDLKVDVLQLEPVSLVVRSLGRLIGALTDKPVYNADNAAAARISVLNEERAREAYDGRRADQAARLRSELNGAKKDLQSISGRTDAESLLKQNQYASTIFSLQAGLLAIGEDPNLASVAPDAPKGMPSSWAEARRRLASAEQALAPSPSSDAQDIPNPDVQSPRSGAHARYYYAKQTLGHVAIDKSYVEGWIEVRLKDPNTPPAVLLALAKLRDDKAERIYRTQLVGAAAQADVLSAQFEADVRLARWLNRQPAGATGLDGFRQDLARRLGGERDRLVSLLGLPPGTELKALTDLVPDDVSPKAGLQDLASDLISDIRKRNIDSVRRTLFENGLPADFGSEDDIMQQIKANTIAERMSYKGFTPVAAAGVFRGQSIFGGYMEAPDPRDIEKALENVMSDVLRKQLESDGRMKELSLHLNQLMTEVNDGAKELEAQRRDIEAAEGDLKARVALAGASAPETAAAQQRLIDAWSRFSKTMVDTKSSFISLVTELEALGQGSAGALRPFQAPLRYEPRALRRDSRSELLDFWTEKLQDASFENASDALLAKTGAAVPADARARIRAAAVVYRQALQDAEAVRSNDFDGLEKLELLTKTDVEGKRLNLRAELARAVAGLGALDPRSGPAAAEIIAFFRAEAENAARTSGSDRDRKRAIASELRESFWGATTPSPAAEAAFRRLEPLEKALDQARESLLTDYLADAGDDPNKFVLRDLQLDAYLKAQTAFDAEIAKDLQSPEFAGDAGMARVLDGLHDVRASLDRAYAQAKYGRGMAAMDALIMLEETRLRAARWGGRPPTEIDRVAESLQNLRDMRARWLSGSVGKDELQPLYALTRLEGGKRTWTVDQWMTKSEVEANLRRDPKAPLQPGEVVVVQRGEGLFVDEVPGKPGVHYELIGGVDAAEAMRDGAHQKVSDSAAAADLTARMKDADFVAVGAPTAKLAGLTFDAVFGPGGLHSQGRLFFFESGPAGRALNPLAALSLPPEKVVMMAYGGDSALKRDRFPTLQSLKDSDEAGGFRLLAVSPRGAAELARHAELFRDAQLRRGWLEVKLNSFGFAREANGRVSQLYRTQDDFQAQWKAFDHADRDLADARRALETAKADEAARKADADKAKEEFGVASRRFQFDRKNKDFQSQLDKATKPYKEAGDKYREAQAKTVNAGKAVDEAVATLAHSKSWTLYRTSDLDLGLDHDSAVVSAAAPAARGSLGLAEAVPGGSSVESHVAGELSAAVVDEDGRVRAHYGSQAEVDAAAKSWKLVSYSPEGDVSARVEDHQVRTKVRLSHYESDGGLPVLLSERYLIERLDESKSRLGTANHWAIMPYNWGNILLEIPRGVVQAPIELIGGRDPNSSHYLGRAMMYKTEGGETEHHGFFRTVLGWVDVLDLLPDPVARYYDPSQFPDQVKVGSTLSPGRILADLKPRDVRAGKEYDVKFGKVAMAREARQASEDLDAARERTLARFNGGVEDVILETRRGRGHETPDHRWANDYLESSVNVQSGESVVDQRLDQDPALAADPRSDGRSGDVVASATPGALFVDRVERRTRVYPGASGYARQVKALDGYAGRVDRAAAEAAAARPALDADLARGDALLKGRLGRRETVAREESDLWNRWHALAERIGAQEELERRIAALKAELRDLQGPLSWWENYARELEKAGRGQGPVVVPGPGRPDQPGHPGQPLGTNAFWAWVLALFGLGALIAAAWHAWRDGLLRRAS